jgi:uncharacterized protein (UPF0548 family)
MTDQRGRLPENYRLADLPAARGYRHARVEHELTGSFTELADFVMTFGLQHAVWRKVSSSGPRASVGVELRMSPGVGPFRLSAPARVVDVVDDRDQVGFTYGTLVGHPEAGEERFVVERRADGTMRLVIEHWSCPARWFTRLGGPIARWAQRRATGAYLRAAELRAAGSASQ